MRDAMAGWNPQRYAQFGGLRLRPALDLIGALPALPAGDVVDLGCGAGAVAEPLKALADGRRLIGVDSAREMIATARDTGFYDLLVQQDLSEWQAETPPAFIFSNAALNWVPEHGALIARLVAMLAPGGVLAVQVPRQSARPSHALWRDLSGEMFPERFDWTGWEREVHAPGYYAELLNGLGECRVWETEYYQRLEPSQSAHPVLLFTRSTYGRRVLGLLSEAEQTRFEARYSAAVATYYPVEADGSVWFPFRRLFFTVQKPVV